MARLVDNFIILQFLRILTTSWVKMPAFKLGIIDENGRILKKSKDLKTSSERASYTVFHRLIFNIKKLIEKLPFGKTKIASFAAGLYLIKEECEAVGVDYSNFEYELMKIISESHPKTHKWILDNHDVNPVLLESTVDSLIDSWNPLITFELVGESNTLLPFSEVRKYPRKGDVVTRFGENYKITKVDANRVHIFTEQDDNISIKRESIKFHSDGKFITEEGVVIGGGASSGGASTMSIPANNVGSGKIAGTTKEPPGKPKKRKLHRRKRKVFAGVEVFEVDSKTFYQCMNGRMKYSRWNKFIDPSDAVAEHIKRYSYKNPSKSILVQNGEQGNMAYLKVARR